MGIREDQIIGLNDRASALLWKDKVLVYHEITRHEYPNGDYVNFDPKPIYQSIVTKEEYSFFYGMFENKYPLHKYVLVNGSIFYEAVQHEEMSSGPVVFLALKDATGEWVEETKWTDEEMAHYI